MNVFFLIVTTLKNCVNNLEFKSEIAKHNK